MASFVAGDVRRVPGWGGAVLLYVVLTLLTAASWEASHDEGVTWDQSIARLAIPGPEQPLRFGEIAARLDGEAAPGPGEIVARLMGPGGMHPPAYYFALNLLVRIGGSGRLWLSLPMIALATLTLLAFRRIAHALVPLPGAGELALTLLAVSPWFVGYSVLARPYAAALCLAVLATDALLRSRSGSQLAFGSFVLLSLLGLYTLYHYVFVCVWHVAWLALDAINGPRGARRDGLRRIVSAAGVWLVGYLPWIPSLLHHLSVTSEDQWYFAGIVPLAEWPAETWRLGQAFGLSEALRHDSVAWVARCGALLAAVFALLFIHSLRPTSPASGGRSARNAFAAAIAVPLALLVADLAQATHTLFLSKTSFVLLPIGLLCLTRAWGDLPSLTARRAAGALWIALFVSANLLVLDHQFRGRSGLTRVADAIASNDVARHVVLLSSASVGYSIPFLLELRGAGVEAVGVALVRPEDPLDEVLRRLSSRSDIGRVTLVDFDIPWQQTPWGEERLRRLARRAQRMGWQIETLDKRISKPVAGRPVLTIATPIRARFYTR